VKGGPSINLELCKISSSSSSSSSISAVTSSPNPVVVTPDDSSVRFYILGNDRQTKANPFDKDQGSLWEEANKTFGPLAVSVVRSFLPITLKDKSTVGKEILFVFN
jgi:hypothetical protein